MKLTFTYSFESELKRVKNTLAKSEFYLSNNYTPLLPAGFGLESDVLSDLANVVESEMDNLTASSVKEDLTSKWNEHQDRLMELFIRLSSDLPEMLECQLTKYGVGGSYQMPNMVIINFVYKHHFKVLIHEFIHCLVQPIVENENLDHASKEGLVDWLFISAQTLKQVFPKYVPQERSILPNKEFIAGIGWGDLEQ